VSNPANTAAAGDIVEVYALTTTTFRVTILKADGSSVVGSNLQIGTEQATTSGSAIDFTGIPAGTRKIIINFAGVGLDGSDDILIQLGDSGGFESTGYLSDSPRLSDSTGITTTSSTSGFLIRLLSGAATGQMILTLEDSSDNTWIATGGIRTASSNNSIMAGSKSLSGSLTQIRITRSGTDSFDAGAVNILYI